MANKILTPGSDEWNAHWMGIVNVTRTSLIKFDRPKRQHRLEDDGPGLRGDEPIPMAYVRGDHL